jgi:glycosyltransferase involved in cell wall biosynthesis
MNIKLCYLTNSSLTTPIPHLRFLGPSLLEDIEVNYINYKDINNENLISESQLILINRETPTDYHHFREMFTLARNFEVPVVYDIDDYLYELPENHPDRKSFVYSNSILPMFDALLTADFVTVSSHKLKEILRQFNKNIYVLPNFLDDSIWPFHLPIRTNKTKPITIGYMGGESHKPDIEWITPTLEKINQKYSPEINFHFYGVKPPENFLSLSNVQHTEIKTYNYKKFIKDFQLIDVDILIAPLIDNLFNQCKSPIKFFEYSTMGVPGIFSNIEPFKNIVIDGESGMLANSLDEWYEKLVTLIQKPDLRYKLAKNAQEAVQSNWLMSENAHLWTETYKKFIQMAPQQHSKGFLSEIIDSLSSQLHEYHLHQANKISHSINLLNEKTAETQVIKTTLLENEQATQILNKELLERDESILLLDQRIKQKEKSNQFLSNQLSKQETNIQSLKKELSIKENELSSINSQISEKGQIIDSLKAQIENQNKELTSNNTQFVEMLRNIDSLKAKIENQNIEIDSLKAKISEMESEVLFYSLSKSWQLTRPLRKLKSLFKGNRDV